MSYVTSSVENMDVSDVEKKGRDSVVGVATCYGLDSPVLEPHWRRDFPDLFRPDPRPTKRTVQ